MKRRFLKGAVIVHCEHPRSTRTPDAESNKTTTPAPAAPAKTKDLVPGNFYSFEFFLEIPVAGQFHAGVPTVCIRTPEGTRWGSHVEWCWPDPSKRHIRWVDDPVRGISSRTLASPEDILGAEGSIGDMRLRFERILDWGKNQIVYALYCPEKNIRLAYGFSVDLFKATPRPEE